MLHTLLKYFRIISQAFEYVGPSAEQSSTCILVTKSLPKSDFCQLLPAFFFVLPAEKAQGHMKAGSLRWKTFYFIRKRSCLSKLMWNWEKRRRRKWDLTHHPFSSTDRHMKHLLMMISSGSTCITLKAASFLIASTCAYMCDDTYITYISFKFSFTYNITVLTKLGNSQSQFADQILPKIKNIFHLPFIDKSY